MEGNNTLKSSSTPDWTPSAFVVAFKTKIRFYPERRIEVVQGRRVRISRKRGSFPRRGENWGP